MENAGLPISMDAPPDWIYSILKHGDLKTCMNLTTLSKSYHDELSTSCMWWKTACLKLAEERNLYFDTSYFESVSPSLESWKKVYEELWEMREQFNPEPEPEAKKPIWRMIMDGDEIPEGYGEEEEEEEDTSDRTFSIGVCVRFKPVSRQRGGSADDGAGGRQRKVVIPLHQRLPLIKAKHGPLTKSQPMKRIMLMEHGRPVVSDPWSGAYIEEGDRNDESQKENSPPSDLLTKQKPDANATGNAETGTAGIVAVREEEASVLAVVPGSGLREFKFDRVFDSGCSQNHVHMNSSRRVVMDFLNGYNGTVMVYGQTGSGKTYTMFGKQDDAAMAAEAEETFGRVDPEEGIAQKTAREVLGALKSRESLGIAWRLAITYVEVYGQEVYDLLKEGQLVGQSRVAGQRYVLDGQTEWPVESRDEIYRYLRQGDAQKRKACTAMNERSSRAHTIFILSLTQTIGPDSKKIQSRLMLVDLGGFEKLTKSKVHESVKSAGSVSWNEYYEQRKHLTEALYINTGLYALKACIEALHENQKQEKALAADPTMQRRHIYVPYQDSKLTMLLSSSLGGSARTVMIVTAAKDNWNAMETFQSLRFGEQCSSVENSALCMSSDSLIAAIDELDAKIRACQAMIEKHERWETRRVVRRDVDAETGEQIDEVVVTSVPVGAELYREEMEALIAKKDTLLGADPVAAKIADKEEPAVAHWDEGHKKNADALDMDDKLHMNEAEDDDDEKKEKEEDDDDDVYEEI